MRRHVKRIHLTDKGHNCLICSFSAKSEAILRNHVRTEHLLVTSSEKHLDFTCPQCDYITNRNSLLTNHVKTIPEKKRDFKCNICNFAAVKNYMLNSHIKEAHMIDRSVAWRGVYFRR